MGAARLQRGRSADAHRHSRARLAVVAVLLFVTWPILASGSGVSGAGAAPAAPPPTATPTLTVTSAAASLARSGGGPAANMPISTYKWVLQQDVTGNPHQYPDTNYPQNLPAAQQPTASRRDLCHPVVPSGYRHPYPNGNPSFPGDPTQPTTMCTWPSIHAQTDAPVIMQGDQTDWSTTQPISGIGPATAGSRVLAQLAPGKYLVSVTSDGYEIGGAHLTIPSSPQTVQVRLNPGPLPLGTLKALAFQDMTPTGGAFDAQTESVLAGAVAHISDFTAEVTQDYYGNPLCTTYKRDGQGRTTLDAQGEPSVDKLGGLCVTGADGLIDIPNLAPGRYAVSLVPPDESWIQTTTLEGAHDFDVWLQANDTGLDTEMVLAGEPVPFVQFGYAHVGDHLTRPQATGGIDGRVMAEEPYVPGQGALAGQGGANGQSGIRMDGPIPDAYIALADLNDGDQTKYVAKACDSDMHKATGCDVGTFSFSHISDGSYLFAVWDFNQDYAFDSFNVDVVNGQVTHLTTVPLLGWFTRISGHVFVDKNGNGKMDPGEPGVPDFDLQNLNRTNNGYEQGQNVATTDDAGFFTLKEAYPLGQMTVFQFFNTRYKTTGVTCQADNDPQEHTTLTAAVDMSSLNIIGLNGRCDVGVMPYNLDAHSGDNGGIVATAVYRSFRPDLEQDLAAPNPFDTGIPGVNTLLYRPVPDGTGGYVRNADGSFAQAPVPIDPSLGQNDQYTTESYNRPAGCVPRAADGSVLDYNTQEAIAPGGACIESAMQGTSFAFDNGGQTVDGNYGFVVPSAGDYLVHLDIPKDQFGKPLYKVATEANNNANDGPGWVPQGGDYSHVQFNPPPVPGRPPVQNGPLEVNPHTSANAPHAKCTGSTFTVNNTNPGGADYVPNPNFVAATGGAGGPFEGQQLNLCDTILVHVQDGQSVAPNFYLYTDVPLATYFTGYAVDDISVATNPKGTDLGEVQGIANLPVGIYDWSGRMVDQTDSDPNGFWESLEPSTNTFNCHSASGPCATVYRFVGNDPGQPARPNLNWNPAFRTIAAAFQAWPHMLTPADVAPWRVVPSFEGQGSQFGVAYVCGVKDLEPQLYTVSKPYVRLSDSADNRTITIKGIHFQRRGDLSQVHLQNQDDPNSSFNLRIRSWTDTSISAQLAGDDGRAPSLKPGAYQLAVQNASGIVTTSGVTLHVLGTNRNGSYNPTVLEVGPGRRGANQFDPNDPRFLPPNAFPGDGTVKGAIQRALEAAAAMWRQNSNAQVLVVVYPNTDSTGQSVQAWTPLSAYFENIIIHSPVRLQGVGPGGMYKNAAGATVVVPGTNIDGRFFNANTSDTVGASPQSEPYAFDWTTLNGSLAYTNSGVAVRAEVVYIVGQPGMYKTTFKPALDGFGISGGDQKGFPGNLSEVNGGKSNTPPDETFFQDIQGGGITLLADDSNWRIGNNLIQWNSGTYAGAIRSGSAQLSSAEGAPSANNHGLDIHHNRILEDGGTNLAGAIGLFHGSDGYRVHDNEICGNLSAEYGGGISHFGYSPGGQIDHNRIMVNQAIDEAGGIMVAGEVPLEPNTSTPDPTKVSKGAGAVSIHDNYIASNLAQDDGGGVRYLMAGDFPMDLFNNMITNNVSAHEGGGVALDDAPDVRIYNNSIAKNVTTATAVTSNGLPAPAGVSTGRISKQLHDAMVASGSPYAGTPYGHPVLFNNILWDNRAGTWDALHSTVVGIGLAGDTTAINVWDLGVADQSDAGCGPSSFPCLDPVSSVLSSSNGYTASSSNRVITTFDATRNNVRFVAPFDTQVTISPWRVQPHFRPAALVAVDLPANVLGGYHLASTRSPAVALGAPGPFDVAAHQVFAPLTDIDGQSRPRRAIDAGADQLRRESANAQVSGGHRSIRSATAGNGPPPTDPAAYAIPVDAGDPTAPAPAIGADGRQQPRAPVYETAGPVLSSPTAVPDEDGNTSLVLLPGRPLNTEMVDTADGYAIQSTPDVAGSSPAVVVTPAGTAGGVVGGGVAPSANRASSIEWVPYTAAFAALMVGLVPHVRRRFRRARIDLRSGP